MKPSARKNPVKHHKFFFWKMKTGRSSKAVRIENVKPKRTGEKIPRPEASSIEIRKRCHHGNPVKQKKNARSVMELIVLGENGTRVSQ